MIEHRKWKGRTVACSNCNKMLQWIWESQNCRVVEFRKDLWRPYSLISLLKAGWLATAGWSGPTSVRFWVAPEVETPQPQWAACNSVWPPSQWKKSSLVFKWIFLYFSLYLLPLVLSPILLRRVWLHLLYSPPTVRHLYTSIRLSWAVPYTATSLSLSYERCSCPFIILVSLCWTCSTMSVPLLYWEIHPQNWRQMCLTSAEQGGKITSLSTVQLPQNCWLHRIRAFVWPISLNVP